MVQLDDFTPQPVDLIGFPKLAVARADRSHPRRSEIEYFICQRYWLSFSACLSNLPDQLIYIVDETDQLIAACALTTAVKTSAQHGETLQQLFSEMYLTEPAEQRLSEMYATPVTRAQVIEVGSMACLNHHYLAALFTAVLQVTSATSSDYLIFTATSPLRRHLKRMQLPSMVLTEAQQTALPVAKRSSWGAYYDTKPQVVAGRIRDGEQFLQALQQ